MVSAVTGYGGSLDAAKVSLPTSAIYLSVAIEDFTPVASARNAQPVVGSGYRSQVTDDRNHLLAVIPFSQEADDTVLPVMEIDPLESVLGELHLMQCRFTPVAGIEVSDQALNAGVFSLAISI